MYDFLIEVTRLIYREIFLIVLILFVRLCFDVIDLRVYGTICLKIKRITKIKTRVIHNR